MPQIIEGNILDAKEQYIAQQCNCLCVIPHGLSKAIADKYPWGDPYKTRTKMTRNCAIPEDRDTPGTIRVLRSPTRDGGEGGEGGEGKSIICMFAQWAPGKPRAFKSYPQYEKDTYDARIEWFKSCLEVMKSLEIESIAFPWTIGCGLAGGNWNIYKSLIEDFEKDSGIQCVFYKIN